MALNTSPQKPSTSRTFQLGSALLAFGLWGAWAYFVNSQANASTSEGGTPAWVSALVQGTGSFCFTLLMVTLVTWFYRRFAGPARLILPAICTVFITGSALVVAHVVAHTANIAGTVAPAFCVAFGFNLFTTWKLWQSEQANASSEASDTSQARSGDIEAR